MAPIKAGKYEYKPETLVRLREQMGLTQAKMAERLGVPSNTLSRWETGATKPDAESLAAIYSLAMEKGITPVFFQKRRPLVKQSKGRSRLLVMWDVQNVSPPAHQVAAMTSWIRGELDHRFANASYRRYKAFASPHQTAATDVLEQLGWRVWEDEEDIDDEDNRPGKERLRPRANRYNACTYSQRRRLYEAGRGSADPKCPSISDHITEYVQQRTGGEGQQEVMDTTAKPPLGVHEASPLERLGSER